MWASPAFVPILQLMPAVSVSRNWPSTKNSRGFASWLRLENRCDRLNASCAAALTIAQLFPGFYFAAAAATLQSATFSLLK